MASQPDSSVKGLVFNIQKYSVHDGPGIRTIIFLKGCGLRCQWCSNPESQQSHRQLAYNPGKCLTVDECQRCRDVCPHGAISVGGDRKPVLDFSSCDNCLLCAEACPANAINVYGYEITVDAALKRVEEDGVFYSRSGGGVTLSGGEPLFQAEFALALLREARKRRIHTCIETCGYVAWETLNAAAPYLSSVFFDIKSLDSERHAAATGHGNDRIIDNLRRLVAAYPDLPVVARTPVIPGFNDDLRSIRDIARFVGELPGARYELLAYHRMGSPKYAYIGREYPLEGAENLSQETMDSLRAAAREELRREEDETAS